MNKNITVGLTEEEDKLLIQLLSKVDGYLSRELFSVVVNKFVTSGVETVILQKKNDTTEILLIRRDQDDPVWPNMLHSPGSVLRSYDLTYNDAFTRIENDEIHTRFIKTPQLIAVNHSKSKRGMENSMIFICQIDENSNHTGSFYNVDDLPKDLIQEQIKFIKFAVKAFNK